MHRVFRRSATFRAAALAALFFGLVQSPVSIRAAAVTGAASQPVRLAEPVQGRLEGEETRSFSFEVEAGDFVYGMIDSPVAAALSGTIIGPHGRTVRTTRGGLLSFVAPEEGRYELRLHNLAERAGSFTLSLNVAKTLQATSPLAQQILSPRIQEQARRIAAGQADTDAFWADIAKEGTPLVEKIGDDFLVTLLWRGDAQTRSVKVIWSLFHVSPVIDLTRLGTSDIWYRSFTFPPGARFTYQMVADPPIVHGPAMAQALALMSAAQADPLNVRSGAPGGNGELSSMSLLELPPGVTVSEWTTARAEVPKGRITSFELASDITGDSRVISVYTPAGYDRQCGPYGLLLLLDGSTYRSLIPVPTILDNLIAERRIAPMVAVFVDNPSVEARAAQMYPNTAFTELIASELMTRIRSQYAVTSDPWNTVIGGFSLGGLAATHTAWRRPEVFGAVLSQSGSFWWSRAAIEAGRGEPILTEGPLLDPRIESFELVSMIAAAPKAPIRLYLEAGLYEGDLLTANRFMKDVLTAKGYEVHYREFPGGHDGAFWRESFAEGLLSLLGRGTAGSPAACGAGAAARAVGKPASAPRH